MHRTLLLGFFGFLGGVLIRSFFDFDLPIFLFLLLIGSSLFVYGALTKNRFSLILTVAVVMFALGALRFHVSDIAPPLFVYERIDKTVTLKGYISAEPDIRETNQRVVVETEYVADVEISTHVLVITERARELSFGEYVEVKGKLSLPEAFETDSGRIFDYPNYLKKDGIFFTISFADVEILESAPTTLLGTLFSLKNTWQKSIERLVPEPGAGLLAGMIVGAKRALGGELLDLFRITGIIHIVVLSGYNITIVAEAVRRVLVRTPRYISLGMSAFFIVLFVLLVGASATAVRAGIMAVIAILSRAINRPYAIVRALLLAGFLMILWNPKILAFDPSFQLSFLATLGLIFITPIFERWLSRIPDRVALRTIIAATLGTQVAVLPWLLYIMGEFSIVSLPVNLLILPTVPLAMLFGFLTGLLGIFSGVVAFPFGVIAHIITFYQLAVVKVFGSLAFASVVIPPFSIVLVVVAYGGIIWWVYKSTQSLKLTIES